VGGGEKEGTPPGGGRRIGERFELKKEKGLKGKGGISCGGGMGVDERSGNKGRWASRSKEKKIRKKTGED